MDRINLPVNQATISSNGNGKVSRTGIKPAGNIDVPQIIPRDVSDIGTEGQKAQCQVKPDVKLYSTAKHEKLPPKEKEVTFLFYLNGQFGDLEQAAASSMLGLEQVGSDESVNVVAQLGRAAQREAHPAGGFDRIDNDWSGVRRYYVVKADNPPKDDIPLQDWKEIGREIPDNPLIHYTLGDVYTRMGEKGKAQTSYDKAKELGYEKFIDQPFHPDVARWGNQFDKSIQPLRDKQWQDNIFTSPVVEFKNDANMMHPHSLQDFVSWGIGKYPAKHYVLVLAGHGGAWTGALKMSPSEVGMAVQAGVHESNHRNKRSDHLDAIVFNSCYMGNLESVHQMRDAADITVASQMSARTTVFYHWPFLLGKVQESLEKGEDFNPRQLASDFVKYFEKLGDENAKRPDMLRRSKETYLTLVALDNDKVAKVSDTWSQFIKDWKTMDVPDHKVFKDVKAAKNFPSYSYSPDMMFDYGTLRDVGSIALNVINDPEMPAKLKNDCVKIRKALRDATIAEQHKGFNMEGSTGLTVWAPTNAADLALMKDKYKDRVPSFVQDTGWADKMDELLRNIDGDKLGEFLQTIQMLGNVRKMLEVPGFSPQETKSMEFKAELLEKEATQLKKEMDLSSPENAKDHSVYKIDTYTDEQGRIIAVSAQKDKEPGLKIGIGDNLGKRAISNIKKEIKLPGNDEARKKLQEEVVEDIIEDSSKANGMASGEFSQKMPPGSNL